MIIKPQFKLKEYENGLYLVSTPLGNLKDIDNNLIEIYPKDTATKANQTLKSAFELSEMGIKIVIGPVFYESLTY